MNKVKTYILPLLVILALLWAGCEKKGEPVSANIAPDTRILSYVISSAAEKDTLGDPTTSYAVTVYWAGSDLDGTIRGYNSTTGTFGADEVTDPATQKDFIFDFAEAGSNYTVQARAIDNTGAVDPTPALVTIRRDYGGVETALVDGPPNGGITGAGVKYVISGSTNTGMITQIEYKVNEVVTWDVTDADTLGQATIQLTGLAGGANTLYFRAVRDDGVKDATPLAASLIVRVGEFVPIINNTSPVADGGGWFEGVSLTFSWTVEARHYSGSLPATPYTFEAIPVGTDPANWNTDPDAALASGWVSDAFFEYLPTGGDNVFYLKVRDSGGGVDTMRINFSAAPFNPSKGILVVNGDDPANYLTAMNARYGVGAFWGTLSVDFWDVFGTGSATDCSLPAGVDYIGGGAQLTPDVMAEYSTIVWLGNNFGGDLGFWTLTPVYAYLQAGGNVLFAGRLAADFMDDNLTSYLTVGWREGAVAGNSGAGVTVQEQIAVFPGLKDLNPFTRGQSLTTVFSGGGFMVNSADDAPITNWDKLTGFTKADLTHTMLYAHRSKVVIGAFDFVRGMGVWAHPNFAFSSKTAGNEFPSTADQKKGNLIAIMGRNYGYHIANTTISFEFMLRNMCGEQ